jgi:hypothetical protein
MARLVSTDSESKKTPQRGRKKQPPVLGEVVDSRAVAIYKLMVAGHSTADIAERMDLTQRNVLEIVNTAMKTEANLISSSERKGILKLEMDRLDALQLAHWQAAMFGDPKSSEIVLKCIQTRIKAQQLDVIDAVDAQHTVLVIGGQEQDYIKALQAADDETKPR